MNSWLFVFLILCQSINRKSSEFYQNEVVGVDCHVAKKQEDHEQVLELLHGFLGLDSLDDPLELVFVFSFSV